MTELQTLQKITIFIIPLIFAITVHEAAHGYVAYRYGDPTAKIQGRLSLNPIHHIDLLGTVIIPGILLLSGNFIFGWAKPVPVQWHCLRKPRLHMAFVALAGPLANLAMALGWALMTKLGIELLPKTAPYTIGFITLSSTGILINLVLMIFNLIPIPPLDGSRVLASLLPPPSARWLHSIEPLGLLILIGLMFTGILTHLITPLISNLLHLIYLLFRLI